MGFLLDSGGDIGSLDDLDIGEELAALFAGVAGLFGVGEHLLLDV